ncbi:hypothetical protein BC831DRAFT_511557 [Entophlyctis helioformis]|nr:hypothetical protein BC831DRAFT_511557 [Entophlyctis helioformis]
MSKHAPSSAGTSKDLALKLFRLERERDKERNLPLAKQLRLNQAQRHNSRGLQNLFETRDYVQAIADFSRAIHLAPEEPSFYWHRAEAFVKVLDFDSALINFRQHELITTPQTPSAPSSAQSAQSAQSAHPNTMHADPHRGGHPASSAPSNAALSTHNEEAPVSVSDASSADMDQVPPLKSKSVYVLTCRMAYFSYVWGQCLLDQQRFAEALVHFTTAQRLQFKVDSVLLRIAIARIGLGDIDDAMEILYTLIDMDPSNADLYILRAKLYRSLQNVDFAHIDLQHAMQLAPDHPEVPGLRHYVLSVAVDLKNKATDQIIKKQPSTAVWYLNHAIELDPDDWTILFRRGVLLAEIHNYDGALEDLLNVLSYPERDTTRDQEIKNHIGSVYNKIGIIAYQNGALDEALAKFTTALTFNSAEPVVWKNRADCQFVKRNLELISAGRHRAAIEELDKAIDFDCMVGEYHYERGRAFFFIDGLQLSPGHQGAQALISLLLSAPPMEDFAPMPKRRPLRKTDLYSFSLVQAQEQAQSLEDGHHEQQSHDQSQRDALAAASEVSLDDSQGRKYNPRQSDAGAFSNMDEIDKSINDMLNSIEPVDVPRTKARMVTAAERLSGAPAGHTVNLPIDMLPMLPAAKGGPSPAMLAREHHGISLALPLNTNTGTSHAGHHGNTGGNKLDSSNPNDRMAVVYVTPSELERNDSKPNQTAQQQQQHKQQGQTSVPPPSQQPKQMQLPDNRRVGFKEVKFEDPQVRDPPSYFAKRDAGTNDVAVAVAAAIASKPSIRRKKPTQHPQSLDAPSYDQEAQQQQQQQKMQQMQQYKAEALRRGHDAMQGPVVHEQALVWDEKAEGAAPLASNAAIPASVLHSPLQLAQHHFQKHPLPQHQQPTAQ